MPDFFPYKEFLNWVAGGFEVVLGFGLLSRVTRKISSWMIILMLILFFSVHISNLIDPPAFSENKYFMLVLRVPLQFVLIWWAWKVGKYKNDHQATS